MLPDRQVISWVHPSTYVSYLEPKRPRDSGTVEVISLLTAVVRLLSTAVPCSQSQLDAFSAVLAMVLTAIFLVFPLIHNTAIIF